MKLKLSLISVTISTLFLTGCALNIESLFGEKRPTNSSICNSEPEWVLNPPFEKRVIYGVGIAPQNFKGQQAQRKSAVAKAIQEIASQMKTTVNSQLISKASLHNGNGSSSMNSISFQTVDGQKVSANIVKSCKNPNNGYLYILMKANSK
jgi:PBP1b-binding outer membrane lipoprotein LpoB